MAMSQPNLIENPIKLSKFRNINQAQQRNRLSFWAFIFSIFMYISIFYIFNLSPSTLLNTTNFWFFISNTLILIIAADFGSFSYSSDQEYSFEAYMKKCHQEKSVNISNISTSSLDYSQYTIKSIEYKEIIPQEEFIMIKEVEEQQEEDDDEKESIKDVVLVEKNKNEKEIISIFDHKDEVDQENTKKKGVEAKCERSNSEKAIIKVATNNENIGKKINGIQRSKSERYDFINKGDEENEELSEMSVEELNRRVEEFIQRFNRQIRLQAVARNLQT